MGFLVEVSCSRPGEELLTRWKSAAFGSGLCHPEYPQWQEHSPGVSSFQSRSFGLLTIANKFLQLQLLNWESLAIGKLETWALMRASLSKGFGSPFHSVGCHRWWGRIAAELLLCCRHLMLWQWLKCDPSHHSSHLLFWNPKDALSYLGVETG